MSLAEYRGWQRHFAKHPPNAVELLLAQLCALFANAHRGKGDKPYTFETFAPWLKSEARERNRVEIAAKVERNKQAVERRKAELRAARAKLE